MSLEKPLENTQHSTYHPNKHSVDSVWEGKGGGKQRGWVTTVCEGLFMNYLT